MEQAIADLNTVVADLKAAADRAKPSVPPADFTPQVQAVTATVKGVVDQLNAAFPAA